MKPHLAAHAQAGALTFVSGQLPFNTAGQIVEGDIGAQTLQTLQNLERVLISAGLDRSHIVKTTIWLRPGADFVGFNQSYSDFFGEHRPARSTVYSALLIDAANIEIEAVAYRP